MSRFPKLSETFVLYEILALEDQGVPVEIYPLLRERQPLMHPEAQALAGRAHYLPFLSRPILGSQVHFLVRRPRVYLRTLWAVLRGTFGSLNFLVGALGIFPKTVHAARQMAADGVEHVHCHFANHPALAGFVIHRLTGIPYSFTAHGSDLHVERRMLCEKLADAKFAVAVSEFNRKLMLEECGQWAGDRVTVVHCGVDTSVFRPRDRARDDGVFTVVCVGTLHEVKGQRYLIEACRLLVEDGLDVACYLVGDGPDRSTLVREIDAAGLHERIVLVGHATRSQVADLLGEADVLVAPSVQTRQGKREGIPVVLMEALASGLPAVASAISGIPELIEDGRTGLLVPERDPARLAQALRRLLDSPALRAELGRAGREKVEREFDVRTNAARLAGLFLSGSAA